MKTLIVDRVSVFKDIITSMLDDKSIEYSFASTGKEAIKQLQQDKFTCICLALYLDDMDAYELSHKIKQLPDYYHIPIVLFTSKNSDEIIYNAVNAGITDIFQKDHVNELVNFITRFTKITKPISGRVLYIEDQASHRQIVTALLQSYQLKVDAFDNAEDAWNAFLGNQYHLVITDIVLTGTVSGMMLINRIRRLDNNKGDIPILAITAFDDSARRLNLFYLGISDYVTKPVIEEELIVRVRNLITNQKAIEKEIQFYEHLKSEEINSRRLKMEALGKLTGGIAHDYNNLLGIIQGYAELLSEKLLTQPKLMGYAKQIERSCKNGVKLTRKLLSFTRKKPGQAKQFNINTHLDNNSSMLQKVMTNNIVLTINQHPDLWDIYIEESDFENALINICINAMHAMDGKGTLTITTHNSTLAIRESEKLGLPAGNYVSLIIQDTGKGMDDNVLDHLFEPFFTTKDKQGLGLGLSQVYGFINRSNGAIQVVSELNKGTKFILYFPQTDTPSPDLMLSDEKQTLLIDNNKACKILVVDDDETLAEMTRDILLNVGYDVEIALDAKDALNKLKNARYDLMISDVIMPEIDGFELAQKARQSYPELKIIMVSGYNGKMHNNEHRQHDFDLSLNKPIPGKTLIKSIQTLLETNTC